METFKVIGKIELPELDTEKKLSKPARVELIEYAKGLNLDAVFREEGLLFKNKKSWCWRCISWIDMERLPLNMLKSEIAELI